MLAGEYAREALKRGLAYEARLGTNPYKFGLIGSTDSHTGLATAQEDNFFGKHTGAEPGQTQERMRCIRSSENEKGSIMGWGTTVSCVGLAAVWADGEHAGVPRSSTRWSARRSTRRRAARILVRFFGGWDFTNAEDLRSSRLARRSAGLRARRADGR